MATETEAPSQPKRVISLGRASIAGLACLPVLVFVVFALGFARFKLGHSALAHVSIAGQPLGGESASAIERKLSERAKGFGKQQVQLELDGKQTRLSAEELGVELAVKESVERVLSEGRSASGWHNLGAYFRSLWSDRALAAASHVDKARFEESLNVVEKRLIDDAPVGGAIEVVGTTPRAVAPRAGRKIARERARSEILQALLAARPGTTPNVRLVAERHTPALAPGALEQALSQAMRVLDGPLSLSAEGRGLRLEAAELAPLLVSTQVGSELELKFDEAKVAALLEVRRGELEQPARDASFEVSERDEVRVVPGSAGRSLRAPELSVALWQAAFAPDRHAALPLREEPLPRRTTEQAEQMNIRHLVGSFTTRHPCCQARVENIHRIATLLDGLVAAPGETVSVNAIVGPRTQKNGFVLAPGIEDGEMVDTMGGGVSQFATTFFNALFHAGYDIIERQPHSYWFPRYPMGHEATLSWPKPDIIFKNDTAAGLLVKTSFTKTTITVKLYGDMGGRRVTSSVSERRDIVKPPVELLGNRDVAPDEEKVKDGGMIGWSVIASRTVTFPDGTKKEERRKVTYKPKARRVEVHPCRIPDGEPGATGERCPEPPDVEEPDVEEPAPASEPAAHAG
jgi:vancomycin resistance protein YoaR